MDLETENRIAAILIKEAAELRRQAQREGALAYLRQPTVRSRPNSRFLTATVRGVQQANRAVEVHEMWRLREKQLELDNKLRKARNGSSSEGCYKDVSESHRIRSSNGCNEVSVSTSASLSLKRRCFQDLELTKEEGLRDDEVDEFLHSRTKRGRGAVGSRMDETGPYLPSCPDSRANVFETTGEGKKRASVLLGPEKPYYLKFCESSDDESGQHRTRKVKRGSSKRHSTKHKSRDKSREKNKKRKEKKSKHHK